MPDVLKARVIDHLRVHHGMVRCRSASLIPCLFSAFVILVIVASATLICEVRRPFVLMRAAIVLEASHDLIDVRRRVLVQLLVVSEDDDGDIDGTEDGELVRLLEQAALALKEGD